MSSATAALSLQREAIKDDQYYWDLPFRDPIFEGKQSVIKVSGFGAAIVRLQKGLRDDGLLIPKTSPTSVPAYDPMKSAMAYLQQKGRMPSIPVAEGEGPTSVAHVQSVRNCADPPFLMKALNLDAWLEILRTIAKRDSESRVYGLVILTRQSLLRQYGSDRYNAISISSQPGVQSTDDMYLYREYSDIQGNGCQENWRALVPLQNPRNSSISVPMKAAPTMPLALAPAASDQADAGASPQAGHIISISEQIFNPAGLAAANSPKSSIHAWPTLHMYPPGAFTRVVPNPSTQYQAARMPPQVSGYRAAPTPVVSSFTSPFNASATMPQYSMTPGRYPTTSTPSSTAPFAPSSRPSPPPPLTKEQINILALGPRKITGENVLQLALTMSNEHIKFHLDKLYVDEGGKVRSTNSYTHRISNALKQRAIEQGRDYIEVRYEFNAQRASHGIASNVGAAMKVARVVAPSVASSATAVDTHTRTAPLEPRLAPSTATPSFAAINAVSTTIASTVPAEGANYARQDADVVPGVKRKRTEGGATENTDGENEALSQSTGRNIKKMRL